MSQLKQNGFLISSSIVFYSGPQRKRQFLPSSFRVMFDLVFVPGCWSLSEIFPKAHPENCYPA